MSGLMTRLDATFDWIKNPTHLILLYAALASALLVVFASPEVEAAVLTGAITLVAWVFVLIYATRSPWRLNSGGRALMYTSVGVAAIGTFMFANWIIGDYPFKAEVRAATLIVMLMSMLYRLILALRVQHWERTHDDDDEFPG